MAITVNTELQTASDEGYVVLAGQTDGNEVIVKLNPRLATTFEAFPTAAGDATLKTSVNNTTPTDFTNFSADSSAVTAPTTWQFSSGLAYVGIDVATGTWTLIVRQTER